MFSHRIYYHLKPLIPRWLQIHVRREIARRKLASNTHTWPIDERAAKPPEGWAGWPDGKRLALVLTHDVETAEGLKNCQALAELEESLGFRSSFNFVAEDYEVPNDLIHFLKTRGFEVGVHGLHHHGNLFGSRKRFMEQVPRINHFMKEWGAKGFRTPSLYHNLDWIGELDIEYDSSTFDTDPFEPQPDGAGTIFPFWVPGKNGRKGYVELPYTLPQDFSLFVVLKESTCEIWKRKLDWIVEHGGMALLDAHPDYMNFGDGAGKFPAYPVLHYREFLRYVRDRYEGRCWLALPREVAHFWRESQLGHLPQPTHFPRLTEVTQLTQATQVTRPTRAPRPQLRICMPTYSFYESDGRVKRYAEALAERGDHVDVISLKRNEFPAFDRICGVNIHRIQERSSDERGKFEYLARVLSFFVRSATILSRAHLNNPYHLLHVHSVPDFEVFAGFIPKLSGAGLILDIHDIVPEFYSSKFSGNSKSLAYRSLIVVEKASIGFSDHVIISNHIWEKKLLSRSVGPEKCSVFLNYPDPSIFFPRTKKRTDGRFIIIYPGTFNWHQGLDIAIRAFSATREKAQEAEFHLYGRGSEMDNLKSLVRDLGLQDRVLLKPLVPIHQIAETMAEADLGIIPKRDDSFGGEAFSTKILEFMSLGIPVIVAETKIDKYYFNDSVVKFFEPGNVNALAEAMLELIRNESMRKTLAENALKFVQDFSWEKRKHEYLSLVDRLSGSK